MKKRAVALHMSITSAVAIVMPGRFACGVSLVIEEMFIMITSILFTALIRKLHLEKIKEALLCIFIVGVTVLYKQLLMMTVPVVAIQMSFIIYLVALSNFSSAFLVKDTTSSIQSQFSFATPPFLTFSIYVLIFTLIRDILGFGTITLLAFGNIKEIVLFSGNAVMLGTFIATIPGAFIMSAVILILFLTIEKHAIIIKNAKGEEK